MPRLQNEDTTTQAGSRINSGRKKIASALESITAVKVDMIALRNEVNASVTSGDGLYTSTDQAEVNSILSEFKSTVTTFAGNL